jgi:hypothetical protein
MRTLKIMVCILVAMVAVGCGASASEIAKKDAQNLAYQLGNEKMSGDRANDKLMDIVKIVKDNKLAYTDIGRSYGELVDKVKFDYISDAKDRVNELRGTHADPPEAQRLKMEIGRLLKHAGASPGQANTSDAEINQLVARNGLEFAQRSGAKITPAMYAAAGLRPNVVTRTRTIVKRVPAKAPAKKPTTRRHTTRR